MKITCLFLMIALVQVSASTYSQSARLTFKLKDVMLSEVFDQIEKDTEFRFFYESGDVDLSRKVTINADDSKIEEILNGVFNDLDISYEIFDRYIIVKKKGNQSNFEKNVVLLQQKAVSGKVTDASGAPVPGVTVVVSGTSNGTVTGADGQYSLMNIQPEDKLIFSFVGMKTQEVIVGTQSTIDITMVVDAIGIEEVVAIGYGTMKKSDLTGSISSINNEKITQRGITSIDQGLQGQVSGVQIVQPNSAPGQTPIVRIRGINSIQYGNDPLWVVDGFPLSSGISFINPNDIESITVLKDASATAIYGARGANGVILVTTRKGQSGDTRVSYQAYYGAQNIAKKIDLMNANEWATAQRTFWDRFRNGSLIGRAFPQSEIDQMGQGTDWQDEIFRTAIMQSHNVSVSGGNEKTTFSVSANYLNQEGIVINSEYSRGTFGINVEHKANEKFSFNANINASYEYNRSINTNAGVNSGGVIYNALIAAPTSPVKNDDGSYFSQREYWQETGIMANINVQNPVQMAYEQASNYNRTHILNNFAGSYEIIEGLTAKVALGVDILYGRSNSYIPSYFISQTASNGSASVSTSQRFNWVNENTLTYTKQFNEVHSFTALVGFTAQQAIGETLAAGSTDFFSDITQYYDLGIGSEPTFPSSGYNRWSMASTIGRINYDYANKYLVTVSARYDGSSRFGENNRFGFFPSGALAWRVNQEEFLQDVDWMSNLKVRASYGRTGNQDIPLYQNVQLYNKIDSYVFGESSSTAVAPGALVNPDLKWETTNQYDAGVDLGIFNNLLSFTADYYYKKTNDLLFPVSVPRQGGYATVLQNIGSVENKGLELGLNVNVNKGNFSWNASGNISFNRNKVIALADADRFFGPSFGRGLVQKNGGAATVIMVGEPIGVFWGNIFDGLWQTEEEFLAGHMSENTNVGPGFENYRDIDGNGVFEEGKDETIIGNPHPDFEFGINNSFTYKNFDLSFQINGVYGNDVFNANAIELTSQVNVNNALTEYINAWDGTGTSNTMFKNDRPSGRSGTFVNRVSTQYIEDGSYVRLQNLTFGYKIPVNLFDRFRIYVSADNLVTLTNYSGYNPEVSVMGNTSTAMGIDAGTYPIAKILRFGVQVDF
ncbi:TonB-dependent receptor [Maribellus maritimus]|uniref:TonB-dependent receptor n=1 Tax=Maribellus maritimus TaxID=2870838 RepID=UPI001EEC9A95|nr:TonB-dependent receptor [Maribellus maritimus]MCG6189532.1 TonB-dependent receptor [Maribellus maritimus]